MKRFGSLMGWLLTYLYAIGTVPIGIANCTGGSDDPWLFNLAFDVPIMLVGLVLVWLSRPWTRVNRWLMMPHLITILLGPVSVAPFFMGSTVGGEHVCQVQTGTFANLRPEWWHPLWAPVQLVCMGALAVSMVLVWQSTNRHAAPLAA